MKGALKIAHVLSSLHVGGAERVSLLIVAELVRRGNAVSVVSLEEFKDGPLESEFEAAGATVVRVPKAQGGYDKRLGLALYRHFASARYSVIHTHNPIPLIYAAIPARASGARVVHTKHGPHPDSRARVMLRRFGALATHRFVAVSRATADYALEIHEVSAKKLRVVENGTDLERFKPNPALRAAVRAELGIPESAFVIGTVGRMAPVKNHPLLVRAAAPLLGAETRLVIVGNGAEFERTQAVAEDVGVRAYCHFPGETRAVERYLAALDVFALSSDSEGMPLSLTEAMGVELPMVSTRVGGIPKIIDEGETGLMVDKGDEAGLRAAFERLRSDRALGQLMGRRGREIAESRYSAARMVDAYEELYRP
ncbi:MAG: glycosyltransferase [Polyangiaceae bacterium]